MDLLKAPGSAAELPQVLKHGMCIFTPASTWFAAIPIHGGSSRFHDRRKVSNSCHNDGEEDGRLGEHHLDEI